MSPHVEEIDTRRVPESTLQALHQLYLVGDDEMLPGDPPVAEAQRLANWRHLVETDTVPRWVLWERDDVIATSGAHMDLEQNLDNAFGWVYVHPERRGRRLMRQVAGPMLDRVEEMGRKRFATVVVVGRPEEDLVKRGGLEHVLTEKRSRLVLQDIDWDLMESWVARATERASDYELLFLPSPIPEEDLGAFCDLYGVMNTAPMEGYQQEDEVMTPSVLRDHEATDEARGVQNLTYVAVHRPSGEFAGFTNVEYQRLQPDQVWQQDTGVDPDHRNNGLGRWLKAAMALQLRSSYPEVRRIDTHNAGSNAPMLNINIEMGFRPILVEGIWQGDLADLRQNLSV
ncbi:MAG: GNAT family N-acetyltransferase [Acidimicrobiia bacterium]